MIVYLKLNDAYSDISRLHKEGFASKKPFPATVIGLLVEETEDEVKLVQWRWDVEEPLHDVYSIIPRGMIKRIWRMDENVFCVYSEGQGISE